MKYHYQKPDITIPVYGELVTLHDHPVYKYGTLFFENGKGIIIVQQNFIKSDDKYCYWGSVDSAIANDIYLSPRFPEFFKTHATKSDYPIFQLRKLMWALRMKPLPREPWEDYFGR